MLEGEFSQRVLKEHPADPSYGQVEGTLSQLVGYYNSNGAQVALVHQYLRPDGKLGGRSKKPTPKKIRIEDTLYVLSAKRRQRRRRSN